MRSRSGVTPPVTTSPVTAAGDDRPVEPVTSFDDACQQVTAYLKQAVPMGIWFVSRYDGENQVYLTVADSVYGAEPGISMPWSQTLCRHMLDHPTSRITPDLDADPHADPGGEPVAMRESYQVSAYAGVPIQHHDGHLFGSLCGLDPSPQGEQLRSHEPLLRLLGGLLGCVAELDLHRTDLQRRLLSTQMESETDELTGLTNRRGWDRLLVLEEERYRRLAEPGAVLYVDIDDLKVVNDSAGHSAGDEHLRHAATVMRRTARRTDVVARLGGDEFCLLMVGLTTPQVADVALRMQAALAAAGIHASVGQAAFTCAPTFAEVCAQADQDMYAQKTQRKQARGATGR
ncbi:sensor domain-containing diguanylate cyclase [Kineosporia sp. J2-2]|uniref:Sensor domain-containing diguanylate cyclase n=1 Tax=Kineosporia corallincola TaxID=2835133 RepID=A0ABS5TC59_9ACTN|nr:sensor domain-containing diguanylate cyclase [Kineosporia corallincola]MBT0768660.1 sensor domain-containing diguanylate cyclase [Kineosporia corallincola]